LHLGVSLWVRVWSFASWLGSVTSTSPLRRTLTATAFGMCALIDVRIRSRSVPAASGVRTLTVALTGATLGMRRRVAGWAPAAMLAHVGFAACVVGGFHSFMASSMRPSLSSTVFWFLLCFVQSSRAIWPAS
jgi:hypothetical protein